MEVCANVQDACRLCLYGIGIVSVFDEANNIRTITPESIYNCVSIQITKEDRLPKSICEKCSSSVKNWCSFKSTCDKTQETLKSWLHSGQDEECPMKISLNQIETSAEANHEAASAESTSGGCDASPLTNGALPSKDVSGAQSIDEENRSHDGSCGGSEEITSTLLVEETIRESDVVSSSKDVGDSCSGVDCGPGSGEPSLNIINEASEIKSIESHETREEESVRTSDKPLDPCVQEGHVNNEPISSIIEPMEVSLTITDDNGTTANVLERDYSSHIIKESAHQNDVQEVEMRVVHSSESANKGDAKNQTKSREDGLVETDFDPRSNDLVVSNSNGLCGISQSTVDSSEAFKDKLNNAIEVETLPEGETLPDTTVEDKTKETEKKDSYQDSDKENSKPNFTTAETDKSNKPSESYQQSAEVDHHDSCSDIKIESIISLILDKSTEYFGSHDGKQSKGNSAATEAEDGIEKPDDSHSTTTDPTKPGSNEKHSSSEEQIMEKDKTAVQSEKNDKIEEHNKVKDKTAEQSDISSSNQESAMEVGEPEVNTVHEHSEEARIEHEKEVEGQSSESLIQNIKEEPLDTHETAPSAVTDNLFSIRVKSELCINNSMVFDDDDDGAMNNYSINEPSGSGEEFNQCDVCNRRYSSLSNYLKHLQTKVHIYNASLGTIPNGAQPSNKNTASNYAGDSRLNYSNDSYSEDSRMSVYSNDSPMLRSRLCPEEFIPPPNRYVNPYGRQATPKIPYPSSFSRMSSKKKEKCRLCNTTFSYISELRRHLLSKKHKENERILRNNERMMQENERLIRESARWSRERERQLREKSSMSLKKEETVTPRPEKNQHPFICPIESCQFSCSKGFRLLAHMKSHGIGQPLDSPPVQVTTEVDSPIFKPKLSLRQKDMLKKELEKRKPLSLMDDRAFEPIIHNFKCDTCDKTFLKETSLKKHTYYCLSVRGGRRQEEEEGYDYDEEEEEFKLPGNTEHSQMKKMHCPICNLTFAAKSVYVNHVQIYHKGSALESGLFRPKKTVVASNKLRVKNKKGHSYVCNHCPKKFNLLSSLNFHLKIHSTTKHVCKICKKGYDSRRAFMDHCRLHFLPPGSKQTLCHKCFRVFKTRGEFHYHRRHDMCTIKLKIYTCNICQHSFKDPSALEEHKIRFHNDSLDISEEDEDYYDDDVTPSLALGSQMENYLGLATRQQNFGGVNENRPGTSMKLNNFNQMNSQATKAPDPELHCNICDRDYASKGSYKKHVWRNHQTPRALVKHMDGGGRTRAPAPAMPSKCWKCKHCKKAFKNRRMLVLHLKKCKFNSFDLENGTCLQCGEWCGTVKSKICRMCVPDMTKFSKKKKALPEKLSLHPSMTAKKHANADGTKVMTQQKAPGPGIRLMKCPVGNKYFRSELLMIKHYSQCDGSCENRCSHCRRLFFSAKEYRMHLMTSKCLGFNKSRKLGGKLSIATPISHSESEVSEMGTLPNRQNEESEMSGDRSTHDGSVSEENSLADVDSGFSSDPANKLDEEKSIKMGRVCNFCNKVVTMQRALYRHLYGCFKICMVTQESITCKKCNRTFSKHMSMKENTAAIKSHILDCHYVPYYSGEGFNSDGSMIKASPAFLCYVCSFGFSCEQSLKRHLIEHRSRKDEINNLILLLEVEMLSDETLNGATLPHHIQIRPESSKVLTSRPVRKKNVLSFKVPELYTIGQGSPVPRKKIINCERCSRKFTNRQKYLRHKKVHGIVETVYDEVADNIEYVGHQTVEANFPDSN